MAEIILKGQTAFFCAGRPTPLRLEARQPGEATVPPATELPSASPPTSTPPRPTWVGQRVRIEDLPDLKRRYGLRTVGGDPDLGGEPWTPRIFFVEG
jgi:hypothetical protein